MASALTTIMFNYLISSILILFLCKDSTINNFGCTDGAQLELSSPEISGIDGDKTADLTKLFNETLTINNKSLSNSNSIDKSALKDDWTFDMVEYDLMEFLQDLSARYKMKNETIMNNSPSNADFNDGPTNQASSSSSILESRNDDNVTGSTISQDNKSLENQTNSSMTMTTKTATVTTEISTSLAGDDLHDIAESSWQYGIFDRFTRARASSTSTTTKEPYYDSSQKLDVRFFNSDECGLRTYEERDPFIKEDFMNGESEASKELNQRRQRPTLGPTAHKKYQFESISTDLLPDKPINEKPIDGVLSNWANKVEKDAYNSFKEQHPGQDQYNPSANIDRMPSGDNLGDSEFNLSSRRHWLQQQLGNTLQLLGFNGSIQSVAEFLNQTSGSSLNFRENLMKKSTKLAKSFPITNNNNKIPVNSMDDQDLSARQSELKLEPRVIGGSDARLGDSPWSVSLQALVSRPGTGGVEYRHYCGGTIISEHYVLTAAHCLDFMVGRESRLFVVIGDLNWRMSATSLYGRRFGIDKLIIHSGYKSTAFGHDIGLIRTKESMKPLKVNGRYIVNSVCLPEKGVEHSGEAELVGWGLFSNRNEMADSLQIADVPILPRPLCVDLYKRRTGIIQWLIGIELITDKQICAGTFGRGICQGDSGSALVYNQKVNKRQAKSADIDIEKVQPSPLAQDDQAIIAGKGMLRNFAQGFREQQQSRATIIGIVAFGGIRRCSYQSLPGVYMQTSKYMDWILPRIQA